MGGAGGRQGDALSQSWVKTGSKREMWGAGGWDGSAATVPMARVWACSDPWGRRG